jgi:hypothetical protein
MPGSGIISVTAQEFCCDITGLTMFWRHSLLLRTWLREKWLNAMRKWKRNKQSRAKHSRHLVSHDG